jgi:hypothetical protein
MSIIDWPGNLRPSHNLVPYIEKNTASSGASVTGIERLITSDAGRWRYGFRLPLRSREQVLAWRAVLALSGTRENQIRVPIEDCRYDAAALSGLRDFYRTQNFEQGIPHSDGALFSDGAGYDQSLVTGLCTETVAQGATEIKLQLPQGVVPQIGQFFSDGNRLYQINAVSLIAGTVYSLKFRTRLRVGASVGAAFSFDKLFCLMRFSDDAVARTEMQLLKFSDLELDFVEAVI